MKTFTPKGIIAVMATPFTANERLDEPALRALVAHLLRGGVHGLFPAGSTGEFYALTREEKQRIIEITIEEAEGRVPVYAGTGAISTREAIELTKMAERAGADAVIVLTPFYISPSQEELYQHYSKIAKSTKLPILLYNNPGRAGVSLSPETVAKLSRIENIVGIKDSSGDLTLTTEYIRRTSEGFAVLAGRDTLIYATLASGGQGAVSGTANIVPELVVEIYEAFIKGDYERARVAQFRLAPLRQAFGLGTFPVVVKEALDIIGVRAGPPRRPLHPLSPDRREELRRILKEIGALRTGTKAG
jgi:4-hydroxy-tetrahydrodipicolinate synthase